MWTLALYAFGLNFGKREALGVPGAKPLAQAMSKTLPNCALALWHHLAPTTVFSAGDSEVQEAARDLTKAISLLESSKPKAGASMKAINHYQERIERATRQLAQLQARELVANQRRDSRAKDIARRDQDKRRKRLAALIVLAGADQLQDVELLGALLNYIDRRGDPSVRQVAMGRGRLRLSNESNDRPRLH